MSEYSDVNDVVRYKSKSQIRYDQLKFLLKYKELNFHYFLYGFQYKSAREQSEYIDYPEFRKARNRMNLQSISFIDHAEKFNYIVLLRDKFYFGQFLKSMGFATPESLLLIYGSSDYVIDLKTHKQFCLRDIVDYRLDSYCKVVIGECGDSVFHLVIEARKIYMNGQLVSYETFRQSIGNNIFLVQSKIVQHEALNRLYPHSVNTMRIVTCRDKHGDYKLLSASLRVGAHGNTVDNWAKGGLVVGINDDGRLKERGMYEFVIDGKFTQTQHPDTGIRFKNYVIPFYKEAVESSLRLHRLFYGIGSIGWDVAITADGPCFIEGNDNYEISLNQVSNGGLRRKWNEIFGKK